MQRLPTPDSLASLAWFKPSSAMRIFNLREKICLACRRVMFQEYMSGMAEQLFSFYFLTNFAIRKRMRGMGGYTTTIAQNQTELDAEELECVQMWLRDRRIPVHNQRGLAFSTIGRIMLYGSLKFSMGLAAGIVLTTFVFLGILFFAP
jgi:hypothetical protein